MNGASLLERLDRLGAISAEPGKLTRLHLTPEHAAANALVADWMRDAGMRARVDAGGNLVGRYEGRIPGTPALLLGSHLDTVRDGGKYDGMLGVVTAIACVEALHREGTRLPFAIEVVGFADEEGVRFGAALLGSRAFAGSFDTALLARPDEAGETLAEAMRDFGLDPARIGEAARQRAEFLAYLELHIEQGPVLEARDLPAGCVSGISGATRLAATVIGQAGHAGTVPMGARADALAAAAEMVLAVETRCSGIADLVGTVGRIEALPGAVNVVPGEARFTMDIRALDDAVRQAAVDDVQAAIAAIAKRRGVRPSIATLHENPATPCAPWLVAQIDRALANQGIAPLHLPSGAGHDGMAVSAIADIGMIFLRCAGGISHNPAEAITAADAEIGARLLLDIIRGFQPKAS